MARGRDEPAVLRRRGKVARISSGSAIDRQFGGERRSLALDAIDVDFPVGFVALDPAGALGGSSFRLARESGCK